LRANNNWGFAHLAEFNRNLWRDVFEQARKAQLTSPPQPIFASDISSEFVQLAKDNALRARVEKHITFSTEPMETLKPSCEHGIIFANLPYGERIGTQEELDKLYKLIGDNLKQNFKTWTAAILVPKDTPPGCIGLKPKRKIHLLNGDLPVKLLVYDLY
jgi:putative N6-adenine-specific DNA methylase